jgi:carboxylesterase type B
MTLSLVLVAVIISVATCANVPVTVTLSDGAVLGTATAVAQHFFGIPYAAPPVGPLRWRSPQAAVPWKPAVLNGTVKQAPGCPQKCILPPLECPAAYDEACLFLDVFTPSLAAFQRNGKLRPVLVFFAGGGFFQGGNVPLYRADNLVNLTDVVVVTPQYRLGALGFLVWEDSAGARPIVGNYGLEDQRFALQWIQANIAKFGGDPARVTLFGQSAGAMSIGIHLISPQSQGLFHAAIMESNPLGLPYKTAAQQAGWGKAFAAKIGCTDDEACLRKADALAIGQAENGVVHFDFRAPLAMALVWTPNIDGKQFPMTPLDAFAKGLAAKVPVVMGSVQNEGVIFVYELIRSIDDVEFALLLLGVFGDRAYDVWRHYTPSGVFVDNFLLAARMVTDFVFECPTRRALHSLASNNGDNAWLYRFNQKLSMSPWAWGSKYPECWNEICHGEELPYIFDPLQFVPPGNFTSDERQLSKLMRQLWGNVAISGNPNRPLKAAVQWPSFLSQGAQHDVGLELVGSTSKPELDYNGANCAFWSTVPPEPSK